MPCVSFVFTLSGSEFDWVSDHQALRWLNSISMDDVSGRRARWLEFLQQFRINPIHRPGNSPELSLPDYLSLVGHGRLFLTLQCLAAQTASAGADGAHYLSPILDLDKLKSAQKACPQLGPVIQAMLSKKEYVPGQLLSSLLRRWDRFTIGDDGLLRMVHAEFSSWSTKSYPLGRKSFTVVVVPVELRLEVLRLVHDAPLSAHMGQK